MQLLTLLLAAVPLASAAAVLDTRFTLDNNFKFCTDSATDDGNCAKVYDAKPACCSDYLTSPHGPYKTKKEVIAPAYNNGRVCEHDTGDYYCVKP